LSCLFFVAPPEAEAQIAAPITLSVDSKSNIYLSGSTSVPPSSATHPNGAGALPPSVTLASSASSTALMVERSCSLTPTFRTTS
jgi:hypothetical protein